MLLAYITLRFLKETLSMKRLISNLAVLSMLALQLAGRANAQYHFHQIDVPGSTSTVAAGNSRHAIVGQFDDVGGHTHGFV